MSVVRTRNRTVYFRLSEDEYEKLSQLCSSAEGARSISDLSRTAVQRLIASAETDADTRDLLYRMSDAVFELKRAMTQVLHVLANSAAAVNGANGEAGEPVNAENEGKDFQR